MIGARVKTPNDYAKFEWIRGTITGVQGESDKSAWYIVEWEDGESSVESMYGGVWLMDVEWCYNTVFDL